MIQDIVDEAAQVKEEKVPEEKESTPTRIERQRNPNDRRKLKLRKLFMNRRKSQNQSPKKTQTEDPVTKRTRTNPRTPRPIRFRKPILRVTSKVTTEVPVTTRRPLRRFRVTPNKEVAPVKTTRRPFRFSNRRKQTKTTTTTTTEKPVERRPTKYERRQPVQPR